MSHLQACVWWTQSPLPSQTWLDGAVIGKHAAVTRVCSLLSPWLTLLPSPHAGRCGGQSTGPENIKHSDGTYYTVTLLILWLGDSSRLTTLVKYSNIQTSNIYWSNVSNFICYTFLDVLVWYACPVHCDTNQSSSYSLSVSWSTNQIRFSCYKLISITM